MIRVQHGRLQIWFILLIVIFLVFAGRLIQVQGLQAGGYAERAERELMRTATLPASRGAIVDAQGIVLARSVDAIDVTVDQTLVLDPAGTAKLIAPILGMPISEVQTKLTGDRRFAYVAKLITPQQWNRISQTIETANLTRAKDNRISGLFPVRSFKRIYPAGELGAAVLGYVNSAGQGAGGVEYALNSILSGKDGKYVYTSGGGPVIPSARDILTPARPGSDVHLTINRDIQWVAQQAIAQQVRKSKADWGTVVVMDPTSGYIYALATAPTFDPSALKPTDLSSLKSYSISDVYEPGSTGKVMTVAAALEEKRVTPSTLFKIPWELSRGGRTFHDHERHPLRILTTAGILATSSNTGAIKIGETMAPETLRDYLTKFGIGSKTGLGLAGESPGLLPPVSNWFQSTFPAVSFGQSYSVTAIQATSVFATIANGGVRLKPTLVAGYTDAQGNYSASPVAPGTRVVSEETARSLRTMLESVVSAEGTAPAAQIQGYRVAGKTGTAQRAVQECKCYQGYVSSFIGMVPADAPRLVINVTINNPKGPYYGGTIAAPIFKSVATFALKALAIPPTGSVISPFPLTQSQLSARESANVAKPSR